LGVSPAVGTTLPAITFVVSGLPAGATATFSPQTIPAGSGATNDTLSIQTSVQSAMLERNRKLGGGLSVAALGILLLPFGGGIRRSGKRMLRLSYLVLLLAGAVSLAGLTGCAVVNGQGEFHSTSAQTYTVTVTSTAASLSQTTTVTLIVE
jgi:lipopolysaccharide export LptBFGC system permease protein LptF